VLFASPTNRGDNRQMIGSVFVLSHDVTIEDTEATRVIKDMIVAGPEGELPNHWPIPSGAGIRDTNRIRVRCRTDHPLVPIASCSLVAITDHQSRALEYGH